MEVILKSILLPMEVNSEVNKFHGKWWEVHKRIWMGSKWPQAFGGFRGIVDLYGSSCDFS